MKLLHCLNCDDLTWASKYAKKVICSLCKEHETIVIKQAKQSKPVVLTVEDKMDLLFPVLDMPSNSEIERICNGH